MHSVQDLLIDSKAGGPSPAVSNVDMGIILHINQGHRSCAQTLASQSIPSDILDSKQELGAAPYTYHSLLLVLMSFSPFKLKATSILLANNRLQGLRGSSSFCFHLLILKFLKTLNSELKSLFYLEDEGRVQNLPYFS